MKRGEEESERELEREVGGRGGEGGREEYGLEWKVGVRGGEGGREEFSKVKIAPSHV